MKKVLPIRLIDAGAVSPLRSQTIYHALAYAKTEDSPDTIALVMPTTPYVCVGFHQDAKQELDLEYCREQGIPVVRRETGGGTVYLDDQQLFVQWIFHPGSLPWKLDTRFRLFIEPVVETYKHFGIKAYFQSPNDVQVGGKKIVGTGAAAIGNAEVVTGNFLFDFDYDQMVKILKAPDERFREVFDEGLRKYLTTIKRELNEVPDVESLKNVYLNNCEEIIGRKIEPGKFTEAELDWMLRLDEKFASEEWLFESENSAPGNRLVKVQAGVWVGKTTWQAESGQIHLTIRTHGNLIDHISINGDFAFRPSYKLRGLENTLRNVALSRESLQEVLEAFYELHGVESQGVSIRDWVEAVLQIRKHPTFPSDI